MNQEKPDFVSYSLEELYDARNWIDRDQHPDRLAEVELLIRDRERLRRESKEPQRVTLADNEGRMASMKPGRMPALGRALGEITAGIVSAAVLVMVSDNMDIPQAAVYSLAIFMFLGGLVPGIYHLYNAFAENRFSDQDIVAPGSEPDPFSSALGYEAKREDEDS